MQATTIEDEVREFIAREFLEGDDGDLEPDSPLLEWGIIDSVGMQSLLRFLETRFGIEIADESVAPANFRSLRCISNMVERYRSGPPPASDESDSDGDPELQALVEFGGTRHWDELDAGARIHSLTMPGPSPEVVLLPEPGRAASALGGVQQALEGRLLSTAVDLPGFDLSTTPNPVPTFWDHVGLLEEWLRRRQAPVLLAGHGISALLAMQLAAQAPDRVHAVIGLAFGLLDDVGELAAGHDVETFLAARSMQAPGPRTLAALRRRIASPAFGAFADAELIGCAERIVTHTTHPTLLVGGLQDALVPPAALETTVKKLRHPKVEWLARVGHDFPLERPDETAVLIVGSLQGLRS